MGICGSRQGSSSTPEPDAPRKLGADESRTEGICRRKTPREAHHQGGQPAESASLTASGSRPHQQPAEIPQEQQQERRHHQQHHRRPQTTTAPATATATGPEVITTERKDGGCTPACGSTGTAAPSTGSVAAVSEHVGGCGGGGELVLPFELLRSAVLPFLGAGCLARAGASCSRWRAAAIDEHLWRPLCLRGWVGKHVGKLQ